MCAHGLEPLHSRAKSRDRNIVRAQKKVSKGHSQHTSEIMWCGHGPSSVVRSHMWSGWQPNAIPMNLYPCRLPHMIKHNKPTVVSIQSVVVSRFCVRPTFKKWFLKSIQVTVKYDPFDAKWTLHPFCIHINTMLVSRAECEVANLDRLRLFHQWECLRCNGHGLSVSWVKRP